MASDHHWRDYITKILNHLNLVSDYDLSHSTFYHYHTTGNKPVLELLKYEDGVKTEASNVTCKTGRRTATL